MPVRVDVNNDGAAERPEMKEAYGVDFVYGIDLEIRHTGQTHTRCVYQSISRQLHLYVRRPKPIRVLLRSLSAAFALILMQ